MLKDDKMEPTSRVYLQKTVYKSQSMSFCEFYSSLNKMILTESQLRSLNFPRPGETAGQAIIHNLPHPHVSTIPGKNLRNCDFCKMIYEVDDRHDEPCVYHRMKALDLTSNRYACCQQQHPAPGCQRRSFHVTKDIDPTALTDFINSADGGEKNKAVYVVDCEFVYSKSGQELASIVVIDVNESEV